MPNYNKADFVADAVRSVIGQPGVKAELIFIDDASTDHSMSALPQQSAEIALRVFEQAENLGAAAARNRGLKEARGSYVIFLDSDDLLVPGVLAEIQEDLQRYPELDFLAHPMQLFAREPGDMDQSLPAPSGKDDLLRFFEREHPWLVSGPVWKRSFLMQLQGFDERLTSQQDFDLHVRALIERPSYRFFPERVIACYRQEVDSLCRKSSQSMESLQMRAEMLRRHLDLLEERGLRTPLIDKAIATYLLDLAQMMRWHKDKLGQRSAAAGLGIWLIAHNYRLVRPSDYSLGMAYIRFKHTMFYNRFPRVQRYLEEHYRERLKSLISTKEPAEA